MHARARYRVRRASGLGGPSREVETSRSPSLARRGARHAAATEAPAVIQRGQLLSSRPRVARAGSGSSIMHPRIQACRAVRLPRASCCLFTIQLTHRADTHSANSRTHEQCPLALHSPTSAVRKKIRALRVEMKRAAAPCAAGGSMDTQEIATMDTQEMLVAGNPFHGGRGDRPHATHNQLTARATPSPAPPRIRWSAKPPRSAT